MTELVQSLVDSLSLGGLYALLALGLAIVFSIMRLINFAHGELMTIAGYAMYAGDGAGLPFAGMVLAGVLAAALAAVLMERIAFRPYRDASPITLLLTSFAVSVVLQVLFQVLISARPRTVPIPNGLSDRVEVLGQQIGYIQLLSIVTTMVLLAGLTLFLRRTTIGTAMRAAAENFSVTRLMGVNANRVIAASFAISGVLAGVAGVLWVTQRGTVDPLMGFVPVLKAFVATVIGGLGSLTGAVAAGFLLGFAEVMFQSYLPGSWLPFRDAFVWAIVIAVLLARPNGLFAGPVSREA